jgi:hypothetical protein
MPTFNQAKNFCLTMRAFYISSVIPANEWQKVAKICDSYRQSKDKKVFRNAVKTLCIEWDYPI